MGLSFGRFPVATPRVESAVYDCLVSSATDGSRYTVLTLDCLLSLLGCLSAYVLWMDFHEITEMGRGESVKF